MGWTKDQMIEELEEEREELGQALDDIEAHGERFECHPSSEERHGLASVTVERRSKDPEGNPISETSVEKMRVCGYERAKEFPGDCHIITCPFVGDCDENGRFISREDQLWQFEDEQRMGEIMARDSP
ncbi:hypothetical protein V8F33_010110 [Rhypophila sp. PSN 637]